jgi:hypothetical protein
MKFFVNKLKTCKFFVTQEVYLFILSINLVVFKSFFVIFLNVSMGNVYQYVISTMCSWTLWKITTKPCIENRPLKLLLCWYLSAKMFIAYQTGISFSFTYARNFIWQEGGGGARWVAPFTMTCFVISYWSDPAGKLGIWYHK